MKTSTCSARYWLRKTPIRLALIVAFLLVAAAPVLMVWQWSRAVIIEQQIDEVQERHLLIARNLGSALQRYHRDVLSTFESFASIVARGEHPGFADKMFKDLNFRHVCVFDANSGALFSAGMSDVPPCPSAPSETAMARFREMTATGKVSMSPVARTPDGENVIYVAEQVGDKLVVGAIRTTYFRELAKQISFGLKGHAAIVDQTGRILAHPLPEWEAEAKDISGVSAVRRMLAGESGVEQFYSPALRGDMIAGFTAIEGPGWGVMVPQPVEELQNTADSIADSALYVLGWAIAIALAIALILSHWLARPVDRIARVAHRMADGETGVRLEGADLALALQETHELGEAFNKMSERIEAAQQKEAELRRRAESAAIAKSDFLANMSHEIRTPMNGVLGIAEVLRNSDLDERQAMFVDKIRECGVSLLAVLNDVLDVAKIEAGRVVLNSRPFDLSKTMESVASLMRAQAEMRGVALGTHFAPDFDANVIGDEQRVRQILLNLTGNAVKFVEDGRIEISAELVPSAVNDEMVKISVADTGIGIDPQHHSAIFEKFAQVDGVDRGGMGGTGLGLSIAKSFVERLGGEIGVVSRPGEGATFWFTFPRRSHGDGEAKHV